MFLQIKWPDWTACSASLLSVLGLYIGWVPTAIAIAASLISVAWIVQQWVWMRKDRKDKGQ